MTRRLIFALALIAMTSGGCIIVDDDGDSTLTIQNRSSYALYEVRIADVGDPTWSDNLLSRPLLPGEDLTIVNIDCGDYDVLVTDDTGVDCQLSNLDLCFDDGYWTVDNFTLDVCAFN